MADETKDQGLVGKVVMVNTREGTCIGELLSEAPQTLKSPYLTISGGSTASVNIHVVRNNGVAHGIPELYAQGKLEAYLIGYRCQGVAAAQLVANMVEGGYSRNNVEEPNKEDFI